MEKYKNWYFKSTEFIASMMIAAIFITFILQIFSRYVLQAPFGWTLELCLTIWIWLVFFACPFVVRDQDHVVFDIVFHAVPTKVQRVFATVSALAVIALMGYAFLPTFDYVQWMGIRSTTTLKIPFTGSKIPLNIIFSVYWIFMLGIIGRYCWRLYRIIVKNEVHVNTDVITRFKA